MKELYHPNVITLKHAFYTQGDKVLMHSFLFLIARRNLSQCCNGLCSRDSLSSLKALQ